MKRLTTQEFIKRANVIHGNKYDYSNVKYTNNKTKVEIICPEHGSFFQTPKSHLEGCSCCKCKKGGKYSSKKFIKKAIKTHGNRYDYSFVEYKHSHKKVKIICKMHGIFEQTPANHLQGNGCPECAAEKKSSSAQEFIKKAIEIHGDKYDYSNVKYTNNKTKVKILCPEHGVFIQEPYLHLRGSGCPVCGFEIRLKKIKSNTKDFIKKSIKIHENKYDYSLVDYEHSCKKVKIICKRHGIFEQMPYLHLKGHGCPKCGVKISKWEQEVNDWIGSLGIKTIQSYRGWCEKKPNLEIDIYIPELNIGIECNGAIFHSELFRPNEYKKMHHEKYEYAKKEGIELIQFFDFEWNDERKQFAIKSFLRSKLGKNEIRIGARKCEIGYVDKNIARLFLKKYHIQGPSLGKEYIGLYYDKKLVVVAQFGEHHRKKNVNVLQRFCGKENYSAAGGLSKIMKFYGKECISWSDNRWTNGNGYKASKFIMEDILPPDYFYIGKNGKYYSKQSQKKSNSGCPKHITEHEWSLMHGLYRVYDCGKIRWRYMPT